LVDDRMGIITNEQRTKQNTIVSSVNHHRLFSSRRRTREPLYRVGLRHSCHFGESSSSLESETSAEPG
jgi:hypothetical protein